MPTVTLPDGSQRHYDRPVTIGQVAEDIGPALAKAALAGHIDDRVLDIGHIIDEDCALSIVTSKDKEGLEVLRHSTAHLLAQAVKQLYPDAQVTIGPVIEDGFYYDFAYERTFTDEDLRAIEAKMEEFARADFEVQREVWDRSEAMELFRGSGEEYKAQIIEGIPPAEALSLYRQGDFIDLCRGPHVPRTGVLKAFKLTKVAGAYWRGDARNEMLQRIYGTAWPDRKALQQYLSRLEEAQRRDHRRLAKVQDLFHLQEEAPGMVFWHPNGWKVYLLLQEYLRAKLDAHGYREIRTPELVDRSLWERSGHWEKFRADMFTTESEKRDYAVKPMSCPGHVQIFNQGLKSYRELPLRLAEFGNCHRNEPSGTLHGLMRVRNFVQDDAHIFCTEDQIQSEVAKFLDLADGVYRDCGFDEVIVALATRPEQRVGADELWDKAERALDQALGARYPDWGIKPGEGAFYGPKIELSMKDCLGRIWQCGTIQVDFSMPQRLGAQYVAEDGARLVPVMLHRAIFGSFERFIGVLIEHYGGAWPAWLAPTQAVVLNITEPQAAYARSVAKNLVERGFRAFADLRNEKIGFKIREHTLQKVPYLLIVGERERESRTLAVRTRAGKDLGSMPQEAFIERLSGEVAQLSRAVSED
ncbi:MAG: threonine--tRNA ligase [Nitrococcus sp.]|nr:threonine--tRNA ligase [Nitrococcus sp.]